MIRTMSTLATEAAAMQPELVALRRRLHGLPEVGLHLPRTHDAILEALDGLELEVTTFDEFSGATAVLQGASPGPVVLLRADMDALPLTEATGAEFAFDGPRMHACGHDLHMTMLVGAVRLLHDRRHDLRGSVLCLFQPGEEGYHGARHMIDAGALGAAGASPDAAYALHVAPGLIGRGVVATRPGPLLASADRLHVTVHGESGHGARPHLTRDPVPVVAEIITALQTVVTRQFDVFDPVVVSVGMLEAGSAHNVIAGSARFEATMRAFSATTRDRLAVVTERVARGIAAAHGLEVDAWVERMYPPTVNDPVAAARCARVAARLFGDERVEEFPHPLPGAEDFSQILELVPGAMAFLGVCVPERDPATAPYNHSTQVLHDDALLGDGARLLAALALDHLAPTPGG
jgi:hippurate hydrolase